MEISVLVAVAAASKPWTFFLLFWVSEFNRY